MTNPTTQREAAQRAYAVAVNDCIKLVSDFRKRLLIVDEERWKVFKEMDVLINDMSDLTNKKEKP